LKKYADVAEQSADNLVDGLTSLAEKHFDYSDYHGNTFEKATGLVVKDTSAPVMSFTPALSAQSMPKVSGASSSKKWPGPDTLRPSAPRLVCSPAHLAARWHLAIRANACKNMSTSGCFPLIHVIP
jgi:hypothetical protein